MPYLLLLTVLLLPHPDEAAVRDVIVRSYIDGVHRNRDVEAVRAGFHPDFLMHVFDDGELILVPLQMWLDHLTLDGTPNESTIEYDFVNVDVAGNTATVRLEVYEDGGHIYTDFFGLYRFEEDWRIVNKIFYDRD